MHANENLDDIIRGANVFGWDKVSDQSIKGLKNLNIKWVSIMPFEYQNDTDATEIKYLETLPNLRRKDSTILSIIELNHHQGLKVMLKPHLWVDSGWRDELEYENNKNWNQWFSSYRQMTLHYAKIAALSNVELFCIATELKKSVEEHPENWNDLIDEIKKIYKGKLTYAANWDKEYQKYHSGIN